VSFKLFLINNNYLFKKAIQKIKALFNSESFVAVLSHSLYNLKAPQFIEVSLIVAAIDILTLYLS